MPRQFIQLQGCSRGSWRHVLTQRGLAEEGEDGLVMEQVQASADLGSTSFYVGSLVFRESVEPLLA